MDFEEILCARRSLDGIAIVTPVVPSKKLKGAYFKTENLQVTGSFKLRAAYNQIASLSRSQLKRGIVTSSSGNFAQGTAYAATTLDASAKIVMMKNSNPIKVLRTKDFGGEVVFCENHFDARQELVEQIKREENRTEIHPFDAESVVAGNGTIGLEILDQFPEVKNIAVPISGGGLISGISMAVKCLKPEVKIWGIQPAQSNATFLSFQKRKRVRIEEPVTVADGLRVNQPGKITFPIIQKYVDDIVTVSEDAIVRAVREFFIEEKLVVEPSGAVPFAAVLEKKIPASKTVCVISGGNIDPSILTRLI